MGRFGRSGSEKPVCIFMEKSRNFGAKQWEDSMASTRVETLLGLAAVAFAKGEEARSKRYVSLARKIAMRHRLKIGSGKFCKSCNQIFLASPEACRIRVIKGRAFRICSSCGRKRISASGKPRPRIGAAASAFKRAKGQKGRKTE